MDPMPLIRPALRLLVVMLALAVLPAGAEDLTDKQPSYTRIAAKCGEDASRPSFAASDYAAALVDAARALRSATKEGSRARISAINQSVARLKECMVEEERKFVIPSINNCADFVIAYRDFATRSELAIVKGKITAKERARLREGFRKPAMDCVRHIMSKCIDPTNTRTLDFVIMVMQAAADFRFIRSYRDETGLSRFLIENDPTIPRMSFCTDTDYACRGDPAMCAWRIDAAKNIMQTYLDE